MITVKLITTYGKERRVYDLNKYCQVVTNPDKHYIGLHSTSNKVETIATDKGETFIVVYGLPNYKVTGEKPHLGGLAYKVEPGYEYQVDAIFMRIDNEPILEDYIKYRLFPGKFPSQEI